MNRPGMRGRFEQCIRSGGVVLFPSDTVYGLACDPEDPEAVRRLYDLKGRAPAKASAVMFFDLGAALRALPELGERTRGVLERLMPGGVTVLVPNPRRRFPLVCGGDPDTLGLRVVSVPELSGVSVAVMQSSANLAGGKEARRIDEVPEVVRAGADLIVDGGELPGTASTVVDLRRYEADGWWTTIRAGAVSEEALRAALTPQFHFVASEYSSLIREDIPDYDEFQEQVAAAASGGSVRRILELGIGTGETAQRLLDRHPKAELLGIDESEAMLGQARQRLDAGRVRLRVGRLQDPLPPDGPFDLVVSALCVHHLDGEEKAGLFRRVREVLAPGGRFVLADVVIPERPPERPVSLTEGYDKPDTTADQLAWLAAAGFAVEVAWERGDLAVLLAAMSG